MKFPTGKVKKCSKNSEMRQLFTKSDEIGNVKITGMALMMAMVELTVPVVLFFMTHHYQYAVFASIQSFVTLMLFFDVFIGMLVSCYTSILEATIFSIVLFSKAFDEDSLLIYHFVPLPNDSEDYVHWGICLAVILWCTVRLIFTRRAMQLMYLGRVHSRKIADLEGGNKK